MSHYPAHEGAGGPPAKRHHGEGPPQGAPIPYQVFPGLYMDLGQSMGQNIGHNIGHSGAGAPAPSNGPHGTPVYYPPAYPYPPPQPYPYNPYPPMTAQQALHMQWKPQSYSAYMNQGSESDAPEVGSTHAPVHSQRQRGQSVAAKKPAKNKPKPAKQIEEPQSESDESDSDLDTHTIPGTNITLDTPEDIQKWIEERRRNWPTTKRVAQKAALPTSNAPTNTCKFFQRTGKCRMGDNCKYSHVITKSLPNHKAKSVHGTVIQVPQRFTPLANGGKSLAALLEEGGNFKDENLAIVQVLQGLSDGGHLPSWETVLTRLGN